MNSLKDTHNSSRTNNGQMEKYLDKKEYIDSFRNDPHVFALLALSQKLEKLSMALMLVTELFAPHPLAERLIESSFESHKIAFGLLKKQLLMGQENLGTLRISLFETTSLIRTAYVAGYISQMNTDLLTRECELVQVEISRLLTQLQDEVKDPVSSVPLSSVELSSSLFETPLFDELRFRKFPVQSTSERRPPERPIIDAQRQSLSVNVSSKSTHNELSTPKEIQAPKVSATSVLSSETPKKAAAPERLTRKQEVLSVIKYNGPCESSVLQSLLPHIQPKTLQRELQSLIDEGRVTRTGIKRWSVYQLAS